MVKKIQLKNGLKVLLVESHKSPVVSVQMWVRTGSADEPPKLRGVSHFLEHLVFKGAGRFKVGEIASTVEASGGQLNAYTSFDQTVYYVTISRDYLKTGLEVIGDMMGRPTFDETEINNEREVVIEEIKRSLDSSHRQASRMLFETAFKQHPYGEPVIGYEEIIRKVSRGELVDYFNSRYTTKNMTLLVTGDFDAKEIRSELEKYFGHIKRGQPKKFRRKVEPKLKRARCVVRGGPFQETFLFLVWPTPSADHRDVAALEALAMVLGQGDSSRLNHRLRIEKHLVNDIGSSLFSPQDPGFFALSASLPSKGLGAALDEIDLELKRLFQAPPTSEELARALTNLQSEQYYTLETVDGMARKYGHFDNLFADYRYFEKFLRQIGKLKSPDLIKAAKKYWRSEKAIACVFAPEAEIEENEKILRSWLNKSHRWPTTKAVKKSKVKPRLVKAISAASKSTKRANVTERFLSESGATILLRPNYDTQVVSLRAAFLGGSRLEIAAEQGANELLARSWVSATKARNEWALLGEIESLASSLSGFGGRNTAGLTLTTLSCFWPEMKDIFADVLLNPQPTIEILDREKKQMLEQIRLRQDNPAQQTILGFVQKLFGDHPYGRDPLGRPETVMDLNEEIILRHLAEMKTSENLTVAVTGHFDPEKMKSELSQIFNRLPKGKRPIQSQTVKSSSSHEKVFLKSTKEQVHLVVGYPGLSLMDPDRYALQVLEAVLAGQGGRLFIELRDKASLAYSVAPLRMEGLETGYFGAYIGCSPDKGPKALKMLKHELGRVQAEKISELELERAQRFLIGRHDIDLQRVSSLSAALLFDDIYGLDPDEAFHYGDRIRTVNRDQVLSVAQRILSRREVMSAVGPKEPWSKGDEATTSKSAEIHKNYLS